MEDIAALAAHTSFADLNDRERTLVLAAMTPEGYQQLHEVLRSARLLDADAAPPPVLAARLQARMAAQKQTSLRPSLLGQWMQAKIPAWQAAAACLLFLAATLYWKTPPPPTPAAAPLVQTILQTDTIVLEKVQWKERIVWRERPAASLPSMEAAISPSAQIAIPSIKNVTQPPPSISETNISPAGAPLSQQAELLQFFTQTK